MKMAFANDQNYYLVQMQQKLDNARRHIDLLTNQSRQAADELNRLRNQHLQGYL